MIDVAYADGGLIKSNPSRIGGTWAWVHTIDDREVACRSGVILPGNVGMDVITNNLTELISCIECLESLPAGWDGLLCTDSHVTLIRLRHGAKLNGIPEATRARMRAAVERSPQFRMRLLSGHPSHAQIKAGIGKRNLPCSIHNVRCDRLCKIKADEHLASLSL